MEKIKRFSLYFYRILNKYIFYKLFRRNLNEVIFLQFIKHSFVGFLSAALNYLGFNLLLITGLGIKISNMITYILIIFISFILQKYFTYRAKHNSIWQPILFVINALIYYVLDTALLILFIDYLSISPWVSKIVSILILFPLSFISQKYIVFRRFSKNDNIGKQMGKVTSNLEELKSFKIDYYFCKKSDIETIEELNLYKFEVIGELEN